MPGNRTDGKLRQRNFPKRETGYAVATEEGVMLFSDTPKGMKARNSYLQHLADGFFNVAKVPETLRIYEMDLPTKRVAELADNCIEKAVQSGFAEYGRTIAQVGGEFCSRQVRGQKRTGQRCAGRSSTCGPISIILTG